MPHIRIHWNTLEYSGIHLIRSLWRPQRTIYNAHWKALIISLVIVEYILFTIWKFDTKERLLHNKTHSMQFRMVAMSNVPSQTRTFPHLHTVNEYLFPRSVSLHVCRVMPEWFYCHAFVAKDMLLFFFFFLSIDNCVCLNISFRCVWYMAMPSLFHCLHAELMLLDSIKQISRHLFTRTSKLDYNNIFATESFARSFHFVSSRLLVRFRLVSWLPWN